MKITLELKIKMAVIVVLQLIFLIYCINYLALSTFYIVLAFFLINTATLFWLLFVLKVFKPKTALTEFEVEELTSILDFGAFSLLEYDENYNIINVTGSLFEKYDDLKSKKLSYIDERFTEQQFNKNTILQVSVGLDHYEVRQLNSNGILLFKNTNEIHQLKQFKEDNELVIGLLQIDNFNDAIGYSDEMAFTEVSTTIRKIINDWAYTKGIVIRRFRNDRYFLITKNKTLSFITRDIEQFLKQFKDSAELLGVKLTLSIVFAHGSEENSVLDAKINELLELAQARGGDQMIVHDLNGQLMFYGGNTETQASKSKTRSKIIAQSIIDLMQDSNKIFVFGHKMMDFDSMGSCIAMSVLGKAINKEVFIVSESGGIETKLATYLKENPELYSKHQFISDTQAVLLYEESDLVIVVDHHNPQHSAAQELVHEAKKIVVIDHHRRGNMFVENAVLTHLDPGASSVCEMVIEMLQVSQDKLTLSHEEALMLYTGIVVDTNHFNARTSAKTFEACAYLKETGIDVSSVRDILSETIDDFKLKSKIFDVAYRYHNMMIATLYDTKIVSRTILSQVADKLLEIKDVDASFVIGYVDTNVVSISARSNKNVNVQVIMEKLQGGGHFNAAASQISNMTVEEVEKMLINILEGN